MKCSGQVVFELRKTLDVEVDDVSDARIVDRHVRPVGMARHRNEIQLASRADQRPFETSVPVGQITVIVDVAVERSETHSRGQGDETVRQALFQHGSHRFDRFAATVALRRTRNRLRYQNTAETGGRRVQLGAPSR